MPASRTAPTRAHQRADRHRQLRTDDRAQRPGPRRQQQHEHRDRQRRQAGGERRVAGDHLQGHDEEEEQPRDRGVDQQRRGVGAGERAPPEQRRAAAGERRRGTRPRRTRPARATPNASAPTTSASGVPRSVHAVNPYVRPASPSAPSTVPATSSVFAALGVRRSPARAAAVTATTTAASGRLMPKIQRHVVTSTIQPPRNGATAPAMPPSPDHAPIARAAVRPAERRLEDRQRARGEQRAADPLQRARRVEQPDRRRHGAQQRRHREPHDADEEHLAPPEPVAERAAEQQERGERQGVRVDGPLQVGRRSRRGPRRSSAARS